MLKANKILCNCYTQSQYIPPADDWPPYHPRHYTPLTIVHHRERRTESEIVAFAQKLKTPSENTTEDYKTASIEEIFAPFEGATSYSYIILIEGAPGTGKTILSKEIACQWANKKVVNSKSLLFLLFMRDPQVKCLIDLQSLVKYFFQDENLTNEITKWLMVTGGEYLTIILDGYDEMSEKSKACFIIDGIIGRKQLPNCGIVITSRPAASSQLHNVVNCRAEILGFTEQDRQSFIQNALVNQNDKIKEVTDYLTSNPFLNALCYIPLNMSILLCLAEAGINMLSKTQTMLYQKFIIMTIIHFLNREIPTTISSLNDLPSPYDKIIMELSQFAFLALQKDQLVFTLAEVKEKYPNLTPANWYGLGLLKPAQYFKPQDACNHESFHFLHYSMQEYMAAYYIASLKDKKLLTLLRETFWNLHYFNTWVMYVGITGGKHPTFIHFLSGNRFHISSRLYSPKISNKILNDKIKCLHLLHCSAESSDCEILSSIKNVFQEQTIDFSNSNLSVNDISTLAMLLLRSPNKEWEKLNLSGCNINNDSCELLCELFLSKKVALNIKSVDLSNNNIQWESLYKLCKVFKLWQTEELVISFDSLYNRNTAYEIDSFISKLHKSIHTSFTGKLFSGILLCTYITEQQTMVVAYSEPECVRVLKLFHCNLNNMAVENLKNLVIQQIESGAILEISFSYRFSYNELLTKSATLHQYIKMAVFRGSNMHSKGAYMINTPSTIQYEYSMHHQITVDHLTAVICHNIQSKSSYLKAVPVTLHTTVNLQKIFCDMEKITLCNNNFHKEIADDIAALLSNATKLRKIRLGGNSLHTLGVIKIAEGLQNTSNLMVINLSNNKITEEATDAIAAILWHNTKLQELYLGENNIQTTGAIKIAEGLQSTLNLTVLTLDNNDIGEGAAKALQLFYLTILNYKNCI